VEDFAAALTTVKGARVLPSLITSHRNPTAVHAHVGSKQKVGAVGVLLKRTTTPETAKPNGKKFLAFFFLLRTCSPRARLTHP